MADINELTGRIVNIAYRVHNELGPGMVEKVYESVMERALLQAGFKVERQKSIPFHFDGMHIEDAFCVDLLVDDRVVLELKSVEKVAPVHQKQLLTYLRVLDQPVGLLINFGAESLNTGLCRVLNPRASEPVPILKLHQSRH